MVEAGLDFADDFVWRKTIKRFAVDSVNSIVKSDYSLEIRTRPKEFDRRNQVSF